MFSSFSQVKWRRYEQSIENAVIHIHKSFKVWVLFTLEYDEEFPAFPIVGPPYLDAVDLESFHRDTNTWKVTPRKVS